MPTANSTGILTPTASPRFHSSSRAAEMLGIAKCTLLRWIEAGHFNESDILYTSGGHVRLSHNAVLRWQGLDTPEEIETDNKAVCVYSRVSVPENRKNGQLASQHSRLMAFAVEHFHIDETQILQFSEVGSGIAVSSRPGFLKLVTLICERKIRVIVAEHLDRIIRGSAEIFRALCEVYGVELVVTNKGEVKDENSLEVVLAECMSLLSLAANRSMGRRGAASTRYHLTPEMTAKTLELYSAGRTIAQIVEILRAEGFSCPNRKKPYGKRAVVYVIKSRHALHAGLSRESLFQEFLDEHCKVIDNGRLYCLPAYKAYSIFTRRKGLSPPTLLTFIRTLKGMGYATKEGNDKKAYFCNLTLPEYPRTSTTNKVEIPSLKSDTVECGE